MNVIIFNRGEKKKKHLGETTLLGFFFATLGILKKKSTAGIYTNKSGAPKGEYTEEKKTRTCRLVDPTAPPA